MAETQWLRATDPDELLWELGGRATVRKLRLLGCGCCRRYWFEIGDQAVRQVITAAENYADACTDWAGFQRAFSLGSLSSPRRLGGELRRAVLDLGWPDRPPPVWDTVEDEMVEIIDPRELVEHPIRSTRAVLSALREAAGVDYVGRGRSRHTEFKDFQLGLQREATAQCALLRDLFGNPFRPVAFSPEWRTDTALALAQQMYESREFSAMPILADALQDAGCDSDDVLSHCRGAGPHVRGCWVVDVVLGKQ